jgi:hypothetical protein
MVAYTGAMQALAIAEDRQRKARAGGADKIVDLTPEMAAGGGQGLEGLDGLIQWG